MSCVNQAHKKDKTMCVCKLNLHGTTTQKNLETGHHMLNYKVLVVRAIIYASLQCRKMYCKWYDFSSFYLH